MLLVDIESFVKQPLFCFCSRTSPPCSTVIPSALVWPMMTLLGLVGVGGGNVANAQWVLVGDAWQTDAVGSPDCVNMTENVANETSAAWNECALDLEQDFAFSFDVNLGADPAGADGMCFVLHQAGTGPFTVGNSGGDIAYVGGPFTFCLH